MSSVDGNGRKISEDEVRVKRFLIREVENHPSIWKHYHPAQKRSGNHPKSKALSEAWLGIMLNMREAFKSDLALLAKYKADTVKGLKDMWKFLFDLHRRRWANEIENAGTWEWPLYDSFEFLRLSMLQPWPAELKECNKCSYATNRDDRMRAHKAWFHGKNGGKKKPHMCHECGFRVQTKWLLKEHVNAVHLNMTPYKCDQCDYSSAFRSYMNSHKKIHQPDHIGRKHMCDKCSRSFRSPFNLKQHIDAVHLKKKPFKCGAGDCEWATGFLANVGVHRRKVHGYEAAKPGRPKFVIVEPAKEDYPQDDDDDEEEAQKTEIKKAIIEEIRKHPRIWDSTQRQYKPHVRGRKEDWDEIMTNLEKAFKDSVYFHNLLSLDVKTLENDPSDRLSCREIILKKIKRIWLILTRTYKRLADKKSATSVTNDDCTSFNWPFYDSMKFLSDVNDTSHKPGEDTSEPQIFKDVHKYVQHKCDEAEKSSTSRTETDGLKEMSTFVWVRTASEANALQKERDKSDQERPEENERSSSKSDSEEHRAGFRIFKCGPCDSESRTRADHRIHMLKKHGLEIGANPGDDHDEGDPLPAYVFENSQPNELDCQQARNVDLALKEEEDIGIKVEPKAEMDSLEEDDNKVVDNCNESVEQHDFDDTMESVSAMLKTEPVPGLNEQVEKECNDNETKIKEELFSPISPIEPSQGVEDDAKVLPRHSTEGLKKPRIQLLTENACSLRKHRENVHASKRNFFCEKCTFTTNYKRNLEEHAKTRHLKCGQCDFVCSGSKSLKSHVSREHMALRCGDERCNFTTKSALIMDNHMVDAHQKVVKVARSLTCNDCGHLAETESGLAEHAKEEHKEDDSTKLECGRCDFVTRSPRHLTMHTSLPHPIRCESCDYQGVSDRYLMAHMKVKHSQRAPKRNQCQYCPYAAQTMSILTKHIKALHLKEEAKCHLCDFTAVWRPLLKAHKIKVHCSQGEAGIQPKTKRGRPKKQHNTSSENHNVTLNQSETCAG